MEGGTMKAIVAMLLAMTTIAWAKDEIGCVFVGLDVLPNNEYNETRAGVYRLQRPGVAFGFMFPVNLPVLD
jgi:hypothetical protein